MGFCISTKPKMGLSRFNKGEQYQNDRDRRNTHRMGSDSNDKIGNELIAIVSLLKSG